MEVIQIILGLAIGFLMGFLTSYYRQKGKNAALLSDIKRLTEEKENVKSKFQFELETLLQIMPGLQILLDSPFRTLRRIDDKHPKKR